MSSPKLDHIHQGDALTVLKTWPDAIIQCVVTSPPYWGLRDYGVEGQIGLEETPGAYVEKMRALFAEVRRVLKPDGIAWINLGDSYASFRDGKAIPDNLREGEGTSVPAGKANNRNGKLLSSIGLKHKDLVGIPWRVAFALQADGWTLRSDIVWNKPNPMPESVTDRPTKSHEYIFLLSKSEKYFYNSEAIKEDRVTFENRPDGCDRHREFGYDSKYRTMEGSKQNFKIPTGWDTGKGAHRSKTGRYSQEKINNDRNDNFRHPAGGYISESRNKRSVWTIPTYAYDEAHFATFPEDIPEVCIKAGTRPGDIVLDPFMGSGTTAMVAKRFKRQWLGIELNPAYIEMANRRIGAEHPPLLTET